MKTKVAIFSIIFSIASGTFFASNSLATMSLSSGRISILVDRETLSVGESIQGQARLDAPIICPGGSDPCDVEVTITSSIPGDLSISPQTLIWNANQWSQVRTFSIFAQPGGFNAASENVSVTFQPAVSASVYYSGFVALLTPAIFTINNPNYQAPVSQVPDPIQKSTVMSYSPETETATLPTVIKVLGSFDRSVSNISVDGALLSRNAWQQSANSLSISLPAVVLGPNSIQIFNGAVPLLQSLVITGISPVHAQPVSQSSEKMRYLRCIKADHLRIAFGISPTCPKGYTSKV